MVAVVLVYERRDEGCEEAVAKARSSSG